MRLIRKFDIQEEYQRINLRLIAFKEAHQPGEHPVTGSKADVINALKDEISALYKSGYTSRQIAEAISNDHFSILPKSITQLMNSPIKKKLVAQNRLKAKSTNTKDVKIEPSSLNNGSRPSGLALEDVE
jgi:hypothetical protein